MWKSPVGFIAIVTALAAIAMPAPGLNGQGCDGSAVCAIDAICGKVGTDIDGKGQKLFGFVRVDLLGTGTTDTDLDRLREIRNLRTLILTLTKVTDPGMHQLWPIESLQQLYLDQTQVTDDGVKDLSPLSGLTMLSLRGTSVSNAGLKYLSQLETLQDLDLSYTKVTSNGWPALRSFPQLTSLSLAHTKMEKAPKPNLAILRGIRRLESLNLSIPDVNDDLLQAFTTNDNQGRQNLPNLRKLYLGDTQVTDGGMDSVVKLDRLTHLSLRNTLVTDKGLRKKNTEDGPYQLAKLGNLESLDLSKTQVRLADFTAMKDPPSNLVSNLADELAWFIHEELERRRGEPTRPEVIDVHKQRLLDIAWKVRNINIGGQDAGLRALAKLQNLCQLNLSETFVTDDWLVDIFLAQTKVFPEEIAVLKELASWPKTPLEDVVKEFGDNPETDLDHPFNRLAQLDLSATNISDVGVNCLAALLADQNRECFQKLRVVYLPANGKVSDAAVRNLKRLITVVLR